METLSEDVIELLIYHQPSVKPSLTLRPFGVLGYVAGHSLTDTAGYYGTVEQQGRLTLHLHMLLWIQGSLSPDEMRSRILKPDSDFRRKLIEYLESSHAGDFMTGD